MPDGNDIRTQIEVFEKNQQLNQSKQTDLWSLVSSIHKHPSLREWITIESQPLLPYVRKVEDGWTVSTLLASKLAKNLSPWALVVWSWPESRLLAMVDVRHALKHDCARDISISDVCSQDYCESLTKAMSANVMLDLPKPLALMYKRVCQLDFAVGLVQHNAKSSTQANNAGEGAHANSNERHIPNWNSIGNVFDNCSALVRKPAFEGLKPWLLQIRKLATATMYQVAVVGEFSRGKSSLLNKLVERDLLAVGDLPTTAMPARIRFGEDERILLRGVNGQRKQVESTSLSTDSEPDKLGLQLFEIETPAYWMKGLNLRLVDTPGVGAPNGDRSAFASEMIATSDASLVAVSATMPLSLTEKSFIEQEVLGRAAQRLAIVVTRLDQVKAEDRHAVLEHVKVQVAEWAPEAEIWTSFEQDASTQNVPVAGVSAIQARLAKWSSDEEQDILRRGQVTKQTLRLLEAAQSIARNGTALALLAAKEDREKVQSALAAINKATIKWDRIRDELERRELETEVWLSHNLERGLVAISENFTGHVGKHPQPGEWVKDEFAVSFKKAFGNHLKRLEGALYKRVAEDFLWAEETAKKELDWTIKADSGNSNTLELESSVLDSPQHEFENLSSFKLKGRLGVAAASVVSLPLAAALGVTTAGIGIAVAAVGGIAIEKLFRGKLKNQQIACVEWIESAIVDIKSEVYAAANKRIRSLYNTKVKELSTEADFWQKARESAAQNVVASSNPEAMAEEFRLANEIAEACCKTLSGEDVQ